MFPYLQRYFCYTAYRVQIVKKKSMKWWNTSFFAGSSFAYIRWHEKCSIWYFGDTLQLLCKIGNNRSIILQYNGFMCVRAVATIHACTGQVLCQSCCFDNFWLSFVSLGSTAQVRLSASFEQTSTLSLQSISANKWVGLNRWRFEDVDCSPNIQIIRFGQVASAAPFKYELNIKIRQMR